MQINIPRFQYNRSGPVIIFAELDNILGKL